VTGQERRDRLAPVVEDFLAVDDPVGEGVLARLRAVPAMSDLRYVEL